MYNFISVLKKYSDFESKSSRKEYWMFVLFNIIFSSVATLVSPKFSMLYSLLIFIPALAVTVRRLHDVGKSGWMILIVFIPLIGPIWLLVLLLRKGDLDVKISANESTSSEDKNIQEDVKEIKEKLDKIEDKIDSKPVQEEVKIQEEVVSDPLMDTHTNEDEEEDDAADEEIRLEDGFRRS